MKQALLLEEVQKLNRENAEKSGPQPTSGYLDLEAAVPPKDQQPDTPAYSLVDYLREDSQVTVAEKLEVVETVGEEEDGEKVQEVEAVPTEKKPKLVEEDAAKEKDDMPTANKGKKEEVISPNEEVSKAPEVPDALEDDKAMTATRLLVKSMNS